MYVHSFEWELTPKCVLGLLRVSVEGNLRGGSQVCGWPREDGCQFQGKRSPSSLPGVEVEGVESGVWAAQVTPHVM